MPEYDRKVTKGMARLALEPDQSLVLGRKYMLASVPKDHQDMF